MTGPPDDAARRNPYRRMLGYIQPYRRSLILSFGCTVVFSVFNVASITLLIPVLKKLFDRAGLSGDPVATTAVPAAGTLDAWKAALSGWVDRTLLSGGDVEVLVRLALAVFVMFLLKNLASYFRGHFLVTVEQGVVRDLRTDLFDHLTGFSLGYFTRQRAGTILSRVLNDVTLVQSGLAATFVNLVREPLQIVALLVTVFLLSWKLSLVALIVFPVVAVVIALVSNRLRKMSDRGQQQIAGLTTVLQETLAGIKVIQAFAMEPFERAKFRREADGYYRTTRRLVRVRDLGPAFSELMGVVAGGLVIIVGGQQVLVAHTLSPEAFLGFLFVLFQLIPPIKELGTVANRLSEARAAADRVFEVLDRVPDVQNAPDARPVAGFDDALRFEDVHFRYAPDGDPVLRGIDLTVKRGEIVALVGSSGGGKSTLVDLIPRFYDPTAGRLTLDGVDLRELDLADLRRLMGIVTQETVLFHDTVRANIAYGLTDHPQDALEAAARAANAHEFISRLPDGYDTIIGERGMTLSGGQRQRLAIARALLKNPPLMIFDEATSALDNESEALVQSAIERLMQGRTVIVIAHRLSTVRNADRIAVVQAGRIVQMGRHDELLADADGAYARLHEMQFRDR